jgi:hypothetical protein
VREVERAAADTPEFSVRKFSSSLHPIDRYISKLGRFYFSAGFLTPIFVETSPEPLFSAGTPARN